LEVGVKLSESEWQIMNALWKGYPASARDLASRLSDEVSWAYTTIKTMLTRLVDKGAVSESKRANTSFYSPLVTRRAARRTAIQRLLDAAFDGSVAPLVSFLAEERQLNEAQRRKLAELLDREAGPDVEEG
jgi:BlaI family penicillinase repressor